MKIIRRTGKGGLGHSFRWHVVSGNASFYFHPDNSRILIHIFNCLTSQVDLFIQMEFELQTKSIIIIPGVCVRVCDFPA